MQLGFFQDITFYGQNRGAAGLEMQQQLRRAQDDQERTDNHIEPALQEKYRTHDELKDMKQVAGDTNWGRREAVLANKKAKKSGEIKKVRLKDIEKVSVESAQKEIKRVNEELSLAIGEKNKALGEAEKARITAQSNANQVKDLSSELSFLKDSLTTSNISRSVSLKKRDSNVENASRKANEFLVSTSSTTDPRRMGVDKSKDSETEPVDGAYMIEQEELELMNAEEQAMTFFSDSERRIGILEMELEKAKHSEAKMLESLISQTEKCEETKLALVEAKLEIASLHENFENCKALDGPQQFHEMGGLVETVKMLKSELQKAKEELAGAKEREELALSNTHTLAEEISLLTDELKSATEAEKKSKKAMDGLASALKEVTTQANQVNEKLASAQSELENVKKEAEHSKMIANRTKEKYRVLLDETRKEIDRYKDAIKTLKQEAEQMTTSWNSKEVELIDRIKSSEEVIASTKEENRKLFESLTDAEADIEMAKVETKNLRDIVKQAINEATVAKEAAEIARTENSELKDNLSDISIELERITKENEFLKLIVNAASINAKEQNFQDLKLENGSIGQNYPNLNSLILEGPVHELLGLPKQYSISEVKASSSDLTDGQKSKSGSTDSIEGQMDDFESDRFSFTRQKRTKAVLQRFGNLLRKKSS